MFRLKNLFCTTALMVIATLAIAQDGCPSQSGDVDGDGWAADDGDCDDTDPNVHPEAAEICDGIDNDCDQLIDEGEDQLGCELFYFDFDGDAYGTTQGHPARCLCVEDPTTYYRAAEDGDCDDNDATINPSAAEVCDGVDNNCNGAADEEEAAQCTDYYYDFDGDGWGTLDGHPERCLCEADHDGYYRSTRSGDCDDHDVDSHPGGEEFCDSADNDCDGDIDEEAASCTTYYFDFDGDGYGTTEGHPTQCLCAPDPSSYYRATRGDDCNDGNRSIHPGATEYCDGKDYNCDGLESTGLISIGEANYPSVQSAVDAASNSNKINLCEGSYGGFNVNNRDGIEIHSLMGDRKARITGSNSAGIEVISSDGLKLSGLAIVGNNANSSGANNVANRGGGLNIREGSTVWLEDVEVGNNYAKSFGAGLYLTQGSVVKLSNCEIHDNDISNEDGARGGGIYVRGNSKVYLYGTHLHHHDDGSGISIRNDEDGQDIIVELNPATIKNNDKYDVQFANYQNSGSGGGYTYDGTVTKTCLGSTGRCN